MPNISFVTEYVSYGCMSRFIATPPSPDGGMLLPPSVPYFVKLQIAADVCRGIAYLHSVNSLHGYAKEKEHAWLEAPYSTCMLTRFNLTACAAT